MLIVRPPVPCDIWLIALNVGFRSTPLNNYAAQKVKKGRGFGPVERNDDVDWVKRCMTLEMEAVGHRKRPKKTWSDCIKADMESLGLTQNDA